jgi:surface carbohydrate biosynthesis protein
MKLFNRKIKFGDPAQADIVIFDECNSHFVQKVINEKYHIVIFNQNPENIWIGFGIFFHFIRLLFHLPLKEAIEHQRGFVIGIFKQIRNSYFKACLIVVKPKAVITYIDNNGLFGWLSKHNKQSFPFIAIQNGARLSYAATPESQYHCQHLFCFGIHETKSFKNLGYNVENFYPCGSLAASLFFSKKEVKKVFDILIISIWRGNIGFQKDVQDTMKSMKIMDELLSKYIRSNNLKVAIILRTEKSSEHHFMPEIGMNEFEYFESIYDNSVEIILNNFETRPIYNLMQQSKMIVSCLSSALLEGFGNGNRAMYYNFCDTIEYHKDFNSLIVSSISDYDLFSEQINEILNMTDMEYNLKYGSLQDYYMSYPKNMNTIEFIRKKINEIILKDEFHLHD